MSLLSFVHVLSSNWLVLKYRFFREVGGFRCVTAGHVEVCISCLCCQQPLCLLVCDAFILIFHLWWVMLQWVRWFPWCLICDLCSSCCNDCINAVAVFFVHRRVKPVPSQLKGKKRNIKRLHKLRHKAKFGVLSSSLDSQSYPKKENRLELKTERKIRGSLTLSFWW